MIRDLCARGVNPNRVGAWGDCTILTRADAERVAIEKKKHLEFCRPTEGES